MVLTIQMIIICSTVLECRMISFGISSLARFLLHQVVSTLEILVAAHVSGRIHGNTIEEVRKHSPKTKRVSAMMGTETKLSALPTTGPVWSSVQLGCSECPQSFRKNATAMRQARAHELQNQTSGTAQEAFFRKHIPCLHRRAPW